MKTMTQIPPDVTALAQQFQALLDDVKTVVFEREESVDILGLTLVATEHAFLLGRPGVAKSMEIEEIFGRIADEEIAHFQLGKGDTPPSLVGAVDLKRLKEDNVWFRQTTGKLPRARYAVIDEVFKANAMTRNKALRPLAEGMFDNEGILEEAATRCVFCTSNEIPDATEDSAFYDRLLVRVVEDIVRDPENRIAMITAAVRRRKGTQVYPQLISGADLERLQEARHDVVIPDEVHHTHVKLHLAFEEAGLELGDRRFIQTIGLGQAKALVAGRATMIVDDLDVFRHTAWDHPDDRKKVNRVVMETLNPGMAQILGLVDAVEDGFETMLKEREAIRNNSAIQKPELEAMQASVRFLQLARPLVEQMETLVTDLVNSGRDATMARQSLLKVRRRQQQATEYAAS